MGDGFKRFVEFATDSPYVPLGAKCDAVRIDDEGRLLDAAVLEAYADDGENAFEVHVRAHMGKQRLSENQTGWLLLDFTGDVFPGNRIVK